MVNKLQEGWSTVGHNHEHISPAWPGSLTLAGYTVPANVSPYYRDGNIFEYLGWCPSVDRLDLVRQATSALTYIHLKGAIHGNVCPVKHVRDITLRSILTKFISGRKTSASRVMAWCRWLGLGTVYCIDSITVAVYGVRNRPIGVPSRFMPYTATAHILPYFMAVYSHKYG